MEKQQSKELVILHFNDAYDIQTDNKGQLGFLSFYDYLQQQRVIYPHSLLVFSGDAFAPSRLSRALRGYQMAHCLKMLNIDVACYGNHDFDFTPQHALQLAKSVKFPWLLGNVKYTQSGQNLGEGLDYHIINKNGIKIGFIGLGGPDFIGRLFPDYRKNLKYINIAEYARKMAQKLKEEGCELIIALTHVRKPVDVQLAISVPQIDLILGGHDHFTLSEFINRTPIIKSGSNFECLSIIKVFKGQILPKDSKQTYIGRNWLFLSECKKVKKATSKYEQLQMFINKSVEESKQYEINKSIANNRPKVDIPKLPQNKWLFQFQLINNKVTLGLSGGFSSQICFAKYVAFKSKITYSGYKFGLPLCNKQYIESTVNFIYNEAKRGIKSENTILYGAGIGSVPYLVQSGNMIYLPSHLVVGVQNLQQLEVMLDNAFKNNIRCYAVIKNLSGQQGKIAAWIKFIQPPNLFLKGIKKFKMENIFVISCSQQNQNLSARLLKTQTVGTVKQSPQPKDIYVLFHSKQPQLSEDIKCYSTHIKGNFPQFWRKIYQTQPLKYIKNVQSAIDTIDFTLNKFKHYLQKQKLNYYCISHPNMWDLLSISYHIGKLLILHNFDEEHHPTKTRGVVMNQLYISNPTYQLHYGYIPVLYNQLVKDNEQRILKLLNEDQRQLKRWFNINKGARIGLMKSDSVKISTDNIGLQVAKWVIKYGPKQYKMKYLSTEQIVECLYKLDLLLK